MATGICNELFQRRNRYESSEDTLALLQRLKAARIKKARDLKQLHNALCFIRAFPASAEHQQLAARELKRFECRVGQLDATERSKLDDTGIAGTSLYYAYSFDAARWLARRAGAAVSIDWEESEESEALDELLMHLLQPAEDEYFDSGDVTGRDWIDTVCKGSGQTDFGWLLSQLSSRTRGRFWPQLYDKAGLWLKWDLHQNRYSKSSNTFPFGSLVSARSGMRQLSHPVKSEIMRRVSSVRQTDQHDGTRWIDIAMASLAARHRETVHFNHANPKEVYLADIGEGVLVVVYGLQPHYRYPLETTMGYLIVSNGVPIGYGGSSVLFRQTNTGINMFDEYRGSEAAFLWVQVMRVFHTLTGCTRFIVNPYQFGADNDEALSSGAFWFYYRLGFRPVWPDVCKLARREFAKVRNDRSYRTDVRTLRRLSACDVHLLLPGAKASELFDEHWLLTSSMLATRVLGDAPARTRAAAARHVAGELGKALGIRSTHGWTVGERRGLEKIAPIVAAAKPSGWSAAEKRSLRELVRAKGGDAEARYARLLAQHRQFLASLQKACRAADQ